MAFGFGPLLAVVASIGSQLILAGEMKGLPLKVEAFPFPWNFTALFAITGPVLAAGAFLAGRFAVHLPEVEPSRPPFLEGVFGGLVDFLTHRLILTASIAYVGVYAGLMIVQNISLYAKEAIGEPVENYAGTQLALRFLAKVAAGFALGWLLVKTNAKTLLVVTAALMLAGVGWALVVQGQWYLLAFGLLGAGELSGVYYPNYVVDCSPNSKMRRNIALLNVVVIPAGFAPLIYGYISDVFGQTDKTYGFQMSFVASMAIILGTILLVMVALPRRPTKQIEPA
jgi:MFS family permease